MKRFALVRQPADGVERVLQSPRVEHDPLVGRPLRNVLTVAAVKLAGRVNLVALQLVKERP